MFLGMRTPFAWRITENSWTGVHSSGPVATLTENHQGGKTGGPWLEIQFKFSTLKRGG
jgi:hypothetical protein